MHLLLPLGIKFYIYKFAFVSTIKTTVCLLVILSSLIQGHNLKCARNVIITTFYIIETHWSLHCL